MRCTLIRLFCLPGALSLGLLIASNASAVDFNWNVAGPADWNTGGNWDPEGPPAFDGNGENGREFAHINNGGTAEITDVIPDVEDIFVGAGADNSGTLNQSAGSTFVATGSWMFVGQDGGTGTYNLSGGVQNKERLYVGRGAGGNGTLNMSGSGAHNAAELNMGVGGGVAVGNFSGNATVTNSGLTQFANGTFSVTDDVVIDGTAPGAEIWIGNGDGNSATLDMDSGTIETDSWIAIGRDSSNGVVNLSGDARIVKRASGEAQARFVTIGGLGGNQDTGGEVNISENAILESETGIILSETTGRSGVINQSGGTVIARDFVTNQEGFGDSLDVDFSASGEGVYNLSGGVLDVETIDDPLGGFNMTGGMLSFTSYKGSLTQGGGTLSPGDSPGTMTITGDYSLASGDLFMELEGAVAGTEYDQLIVTGDVSLAGELTLAGAYVPNANDVFTLIDNQGINAVSGAFTGLAEGATVSFNGIDLTLSYLGGDGNDVILSAPVPEPATLALLACMSLVNFVTRRRG